MIAKQLQQDTAKRMSLVTHIETPQGQMHLLKPKYTVEDTLELNYLLRHKRDLDEIENTLIGKSCANIFDPTVKLALTEVRQSKQYVKVRTNYLCGLLTEPKYQ